MVMVMVMVNQEYEVCQMQSDIKSHAEKVGLPLLRLDCTTSATSRLQIALDSNLE